MKPLQDTERKTFQSMGAATRAGALALTRSRLKVGIPAGTEVAAIVGIAATGDVDPEKGAAVAIVPFGILMPGDPYDMLVSPAEIPQSLEDLGRALGTELEPVVEAEPITAG